MFMERLMIDLLGTGIGYFATLLFYGTFWVKVNIRKRFYIFGVVLIATVDIVFTTFFINTAVLVATTFVSMFALSLFFASRVSYKLLLSFLILAILLLSELPVGVIIMQILDVTIEQMPETTWIYFIGVLASKLLSLFIVCIIKLFWKTKRMELGRRFNILMVIVAAMPIMIGLIVFGYMADIYIFRTPIFGIATIVFSLLLVFIIIYILNNQFKVMEYEKQHKMARAKSEMQVEHYQKLYHAQHEVREIRHDLCNSLTAVSGVLRGGNVDDALGYIEKIAADVMRTAEVISTGLPTVDAVLSTKIARAVEHGSRILHTVKVENEVLINQIDLGIIIATALDNAIEGVQRSGSEDKTVILDIESVSDYISIYVENSACTPVNEKFETSKSDAANHGFGMKQMSSIAKKYNGAIRPEYNQEKGKFYLRILMENKSE